MAPQLLWERFASSCTAGWRHYLLGKSSCRSSWWCFTESPEEPILILGDTYDISLFRRKCCILSTIEIYCGETYRHGSRLIDRLWLDGLCTPGAPGLLGPASAGDSAPLEGGG